MKNKKQIRVWLPVVLWMGVIFWLSAQTGDDSGNMSGFIADIIHKFIPGEALADSLEFLVRKAAHLTEYLVLGLLLHRAVRISTRTKAWSWLYSAGTAELIGIFYAVSDEFHQSFVPGRSPQIIDVLIDSSGVLAGVLIYGLVCFCLRKKKEPEGAC